MRIRADGKYTYRRDEIEWASDFWSCNKTEAIIRSIEFTRQMHHALERAIEHPDMNSDLAECLSTSQIQLMHQVETDIEIRE